MSNEVFPTTFEKLTGHSPFPWQCELYRRFEQGDIPSSCSLPTGLGKTSVVAIWLIALANHTEKMPRRLVYVVNRRTVVDQTTNEVEQLRENLGKCEALTPLKEKISSLEISTLRGQFADNRKWSADPSKPAVIVGTVDMIGSRLLFSGYRSGFKTRPLQAGFLGQDVLLVHDEAHLEPAFQKLLLEIEKEQRQCNDNKLFQFRVMELSATSRSEGSTFELSPKDEAHEVVQQRIRATKKIVLHQLADEKKLAEEIAERASSFRESSRAVLIFVRRVDDVDKVLKKLPKDRKALSLTGTMRGLERDKLVDEPLFQRFLPHGVSDEETVYLVCTSAGEVGVNISADHLVCDLSTFDSMAQRFGRVNRFGDRDDTEIHVLHPQSFDEKDAREVQRSKTLEVLHKLNGDGSPAAINGLDAKERANAFAPRPTILPVSDILFDAWTMTTIREELPGRPPVEPYLHGLFSDLPETHVAWREEVQVIQGEFLKLYRPEELLADYPLKPHELLRDNSSRVFDRMKKLRCDPKTRVWIVTSNGSVEVQPLEKLIEGGKESLAFKTVLLPPSAGGLEKGVLSSTSPNADDVADLWGNDEAKPRRKREWSQERTPVIPPGMRLIRTIDLKALSEDPEDNPEDQRYWHWSERASSGDTEGSTTATGSVSWQVHTDDVVREVKAIIANLSLSEEVKRAVILAARFHDLGKRRKLWQRSIGNRNPSLCLAKSGKGMRPLEITKYRHELGSLLDAQDEPEFQKLNADSKDLVLHLVAAHHGRGRPHFSPEESFDPGHDEVRTAETVHEVPQRFARLQRKYGRWGLAYLESLLRAADYVASAEPSAFVVETEEES